MNNLISKIPLKSLIVATIIILPTLALVASHYAPVQTGTTIIELKSNPIKNNLNGAKKVKKTID
jgi:hypothetical protein